MKRISAALALLLLLGVGVALEVTGGRNATLEWDYDYVKDPPCSDTMTKTPPGKGCVIGFNVWIGPPTARKDQKFVGNVKDEKGHIVSKRIRTTVSVHEYGKVPFCVASVAKDPKGRTIESLPICSTQFVLPFGILKK